MNLALKEFLSFLEKDDDGDYGDFKREVDLHLRRLIEEMRITLREDVKHLEDFNPPEL